MKEYQEQALLETLQTIAQHLGVLAEYAEMLRIAASGEKVYEVGAFVLSVTSNGDRCVYLYATHPGLQYRVCTVYEERFGELPFTISANAKTWDAEVAPSRGGAAQRGYLCDVAPFKISIVPTGKQTDAGLPVHRFNRVLTVQERQAAENQAPNYETPAPAQPPVTPATSALNPPSAPIADREFDDLPSASNGASIPTSSGTGRAALPAGTQSTRSRGRPIPTCMSC